jgi:hypothetical protein
MTHQITVKAETVAMMVVGTITAVGRTTAATFGMTTVEITTIIIVVTTVIGLIRMVIEIAVMAITISTITLEDVIYASHQPKSQRSSIPRKLSLHGI